ncbi:MAG TPA: hypothetical protein VGE54_06435 [Brevundimonas sp.]
MADTPQKSPWKLIAMVGISDMVLGVALAVATLTGTLDLGTTGAVVGGLLALAGAVVFVWARERGSREAGL